VAEQNNYKVTACYNTELENMAVCIAGHAVAFLSEQI
jgi:hypothetical protein